MSPSVLRAPPAGFLSALVPALHRHAFPVEGPGDDDDDDDPDPPIGDPPDDDWDEDDWDGDGDDGDDDDDEDPIQLSRRPGV